MKRQFLTALAILLVFTGVSRTDDSKKSPWIQVYKENPRYWQYKGKPVLLLGGSKDDSLFQIPDLKQHLDDLAAVGGNYIRNTMSSRQDKGFEVYRYLRLPNGKYDLNQWNPQYWKRFENMLKWTHERDIIVQIEVWDRFDYSKKNWEICPWRPGNNINYSNEESGLAEQYSAHPSRDKQPFFYTIPGMSKYRKQYDIIRKHQERYVAKMLSYSLKYGNVLYCMNNETTTPPKWGQHWMKFIRDRAAQKGVKVYATDMFDDGWKPKTSAKTQRMFGNPQIYPFMDVSQVNSRTFNQDHWENIIWLTNQAKKHPRPLNHTKIYSDGQKSWGTGTPVDGVERFWRNLIAGSASCRFHRPSSGIGLNKTAKACIRAARKVESLVHFWDVDPRMDLLRSRKKDEAYLAADPGKRYILFFTDGGSVELNLSGISGALVVRWINITTGVWGKTYTLQPDGWELIASPAQGPWVAAITKSAK
jgi:Family of unknown function (DUF6298)